MHDGKLIVVRDNAGPSTIDVLDAKTGKTLWQKNRDERTAWATPRVVRHSGEDTGHHGASGFVRVTIWANGDVIWQCGGLTGNVTPCPVIQGDHVICMSGYKGHAALAIPLNQTGDISKSTEILWKAKRHALHSVAAAV